MQKIATTKESLKYTFFFTLKWKIIVCYSERIFWTKITISHVIQVSNDYQKTSKITENYWILMSWYFQIIRCYFTKSYTLPPKLSTKYEFKYLSWWLIYHLNVICILQYNKIWYYPSTWIRTSNLNLRKHQGIKNKHIHTKKIDTIHWWCFHWIVLHFFFKLYTYAHQ